MINPAGLFYPVSSPFSMGMSSVFSMSQPPSVSGADLPQPVPVRLQNGVNAYCQQVPFLRQSQVSVLLPMGAQLTGIRELLPALLVQGSPTAKAMMTQLRSWGILVSPHLTGDKLQIDVTGPAGSETHLLDTALRLLTRPRIEAPSFEAVRRETLEALQNGRSNPDVPLEEAVAAAFYGKTHPYAVSGPVIANALRHRDPPAVIAAYTRAVQSIGQAQVMMISAQPAVTQAAQINQAIAHHSWIGYPMAPLLATPPVTFSQPMGEPVQVPNEALQQAHLLKVWRAPSVGDPEYPAFCVLRGLLEDSAGRFFKVLRTQKGLVYGTQETYTGNLLSGTSYSIRAQVGFNRIEEALGAVEQVVQSLIQTPVSLQELAMVKRKYLLSLRSTMQTADGVGALGNPWLQRNLPLQHPMALQRAIAQVTPQDVQRVATRLFDPAKGYSVTGISAPKAVLNRWAADHALMTREKNQK